MDNELDVRLSIIIKKELELLVRTEISDTDKFISVGIDSLMATKFVRGMYQNYGIDIRLKDFFENQSIKELSSFISHTYNSDIEEGEI